MFKGRIRSSFVMVYSVLSLMFVSVANAQEKDHIDENEHAPKTIQKEEKVFDANEVIFEHVLDAHEFHFLSYKDAEGHEHHATIPLPVILYSPQKGLSIFMSSAFHHGEHEVDG